MRVSTCAMASEPSTMAGTPAKGTPDRDASFFMTRGCPAIPGRGRGMLPGFEGRWALTSSGRPAPRPPRSLARAPPGARAVTHQPHARVDLQHVEGVMGHGAGLGLRLQPAPVAGGHPTAEAALEIVPERPRTDPVQQLAADPVGLDDPPVERAPRLRRLGQQLEVWPRAGELAAEPPQVRVVHALDDVLEELAGRLAAAVAERVRAEREAGEAEGAGRLSHRRPRGRRRVREARPRP